eukprot:sb/3469424/
MQVSAETHHFLFNLGDTQRSHMVPTEPSACPAIKGTSPDIRVSICNWCVRYEHSANTCHTYTLLDTRNDMINANLKVYREVEEIDMQPRQDIKQFLENYKSDLQLLKQGGKFEDLPKGFISERNYYAASNIVSTPECTAIVNLIKEHGKENDGYEAYQNKGSSPFTDSEKFYGLELDAIIEYLLDMYFEMLYHIVIPSIIFSPPGECRRHSPGCLFVKRHRGLEFDKFTY